MTTEEKVQILYSKDISLAFETLKQMEEITEGSNEFYPYINEFINMVKSDKYTIKVRGFRMLCKLAKWDDENVINDNIDDILVIFDDEKPTAVRQAFEFIRFMFPYKKELSDIIHQKVLSINISKFKDTMKPLIEKDIDSLVQLLELVQDMDIEIVN